MDIRVKDKNLSGFKISFEVTTVNSKVLNILLYILLAIILCGIIFASYVFLMFNDLVENFGNGILKLIFLFVYMCMFSLPIIFRKRIKVNWLLPFLLVLSTVLAIVFNGVIYNEVDNYVSIYTRQKWDTHSELRFYMIDDLEKKYKFIGKTEQNVTDVLGEPTNIVQYNDYKVFEYYIRSDYIDPYTYDLKFDNGVVVNTGVVQH